MKTFKTYLPIFTGFYNTIFEPSSEDCEIDYINDERKLLNLPKIDYDDCNFDYNTYNSNVMDSCIEYVENELKDLGFKCTIKNQSLISPKYYNFSNDSINIDIDIDIDSLKKYLVDNLSEFQVYLSNKYTSCSGFISSYSNNALEWLNNEIENNSDHCIGSILDFILNNEIEDCELQMFYSLTDCYISVENYDELTTK